MKLPNFQLIIDSDEKLPLEFPSREITTVREKLDTGDYAIRINGKLEPIRIERKSIADLFTSFSGDAYRREKEKINRARSLHVRYVLAIEGNCSEIRKGHRYFKEGTWHTSGKDGLTQVRQLMRISQKYNVEVWYCQDRADMAFRIQEYLMTQVRHYTPLRPSGLAAGSE